MVSDIAARLCQRIADARKSAGLTQAALESELGLSAGTMSKIESGTRDVSSTELAALASICGKSVGWFFADGAHVAVHFRGGVGDDESRRDLAWFSEFATAYRGLRKRVEGTKRAH
jgi:transcriptional regulator with XRE-family HTH domain